MDEAERLTVELIGRYEADQEQRVKKADAATAIERAAVKARAIGIHLTRVQAKHLLGEVTGIDYRSAEGALAPIYKAIERGLIRTSVLGGVVVLETNSFIVWLRQYKPRPRKSQKGQVPH